MLMDTLAKYNLIDKGVISFIKHLNENSDFPYKYYDGGQLHVDDFVKGLDSLKIAKQYTESFLDVVAESTPDKMFLTEKTAKPILFKMPFIVVGTKGFHQKLVDLGFELYDEIIDYSFDNCDSLEDRVEAVVKNVQHIVEQDAQSLYEKIKHKIVYNYVRLLEITQDNTYIPNTVKHFFVHNLNNPNIKDNTHQHSAALVHRFLTNKPKKTKFINIWSSSHDVYSSEIETNHEKINQVVMFSATEFVYNRVCGDDSNLEKTIDTCNKYSIPVTLLTSTYTYNKNILDWSEDRYKNVAIIDLPSYWISRTILTLNINEHLSQNSKLGYDMYNPNVCRNNNIDHLYITMNNLAQPHRCLVMDLLCKYDLIERGAISWRDVLRQYDGVRTELVSESEKSGIYKWKHWKPKKMILDVPMDMTSNVRQECLPMQYASSFMQIVTESSHEYFFISEKTTMPLLFNKLFLVAGSKNFHANLKDMGFELYDELFDYSFDQQSDIILRYEGLIRNIFRYKNKSPAQLQQLIESVWDKISHNRNHAIYLSKNIPKIWDNIVNKSDSTTINFVTKDKIAKLLL